ncbi:hypothetical protein [Micromonospora sp. NPDC050276]|uniref:hypothetical protein n=1 Tax=Micromonospora sp. NPDC050276 TaxID=3364278 RepID=UPI0037A0B606
MAAQFRAGKGVDRRDLDVVRHRHACCDGVNDVPALAAALRTLQRAFAAELTPAQAAAAAAGARARKRGPALLGSSPARAVEAGRVLTC